MQIDSLKEFFIYFFKIAGFPFLTFILINSIYALFFKIIKPKKTIPQKLSEKTKHFFYLLVIIIPITYLLVNLLGLQLSEKILVIGVKILHFLIYIIGIIVVIIIIEALSIIIFDWFLAYQKSKEVSTLLRDLIKAGVYLIFFLVFLRKILHIDVTTIIMSSAAISIILGLALQETLGNLFSGLALHISKPYSLGDWVKVGNYIGKVEKIDWRSTVIKTFTNDYITIPNSSISKVEVENFSIPSRIHARYIEVGTHYRHPPNKVIKALLESTLETEGVLNNPKPRIFLTSYGDFSIGYKIKFWIEDFSLVYDIDSKVMRKIWYRFKRDKIQIPFPIRDIYHHRPETYEEEIKKIIKVLRRTYFLQNLAETEYSNLAQKIKVEIFAQNETVFNQGDMGNTFYIIKDGRVQITIKNTCQEIVLQRELVPEDFFGEMSLLTGEPRSATIQALEDTELFVLEKEDLRELLETKPKIREEISRVLAERKIRTDKSIEECIKASKTPLTDTEAKEVETLSKHILKRIKDFFSI